MRKLSVVVPVYYNEHTLAALHVELSRIAALFNDVDFEFVFVDDGSRDRSFEILEEIARKDSRTRVIRLARNFGANAAILAGMSHATGDGVAFVAADLQDPPDVLGEMIKAWREGHKVILAVRRNRDDPLLSRWLAAAFNTIFHYLVMNDAPPSGVGFFLVDRQVADVVVRCEEKNANLIALIVWLGYRSHNIEYDRPARPGGKSRWTFRKKARYAIDTFVAFSYLPIRLASLAGIMLSLVGAMASVYVIGVRLFWSVVVEGWASLMVVLLLVSGVQMTILGVLGEYLWRTLDQSRKRPVFVVDSIVEQRTDSPQA